MNVLINNGLPDKSRLMPEVGFLANITNITKLFYIFKGYVVLNSFKGGVLKEKTTIINYKDYLFRTISCLLAAHVIVMMGRPQLSTFQALTIPSYYRTLAINFVIALILAFAVKKITILLDRRHDWYQDIWRRALLQFIFGVITVSILSFFLVWLYFHAFGQDIVGSGYLDYELPFSVALITILNFYYVAYYFYTYPRILQETIVHKQVVQMDATRGYTAMENKYDNNDAIDSRKNKELKEILIVETPIRSIPIHVKDIAMFFIYERATFIRTTGAKSLNDCLSIPSTLSDISEFVDEQIFFRINRKCIINFKTIDSFRACGGKNLLITLKPEYDMENIQREHWEKLIIVSGDKVAEFKSWMNR